MAFKSAFVKKARQRGGRAGRDLSRCLRVADHTCQGVGDVGQWGSGGDWESGRGPDCAFGEGRAVNLAVLPHVLTRPFAPPPAPPHPTPQVYDRYGQGTLTSPAFAAWFGENAHWLRPYAAFCFLRDIFQVRAAAWWR